MPTASAGFSNTTVLPGRDALAIIGPTLEAQIGFDPAYRNGQPTPPNLAPQLYRVLIDTGASHSSVDSALAEELGLPLQGTASITGVGGALEVNTYRAMIFIPALNTTLHGELPVAYFRTGGQPHSAILGRDFLRDYTMVYEGRTGQVTLSND